MVTGFDNREIAVIFWLAVFLVWALSKRQSRKSLVDVFRALFVKSILVSLALMALYICLTAAILSCIGLWETTHLKSTIIWSIVVAAVMLFDIKTISGDEHLFRKAALDNVKITVVVDFLVNLYVFNLLIEVIFVPFTALLGGMLVIAESDGKYKPLEKLINGALMVLGVMLIGYAGYRIYGDFGSFVQLRTVKDFAVPLALSFMFLPFICLVVVFVRYDNLFARLGFFIKDPILCQYTKRQLLMTYHFKLKRLDAWAKRLPHLELNSKQDVADSLQNTESTA